MGRLDGTPEVPGWVCRGWEVVPVLCGVVVVTVYIPSRLGGMHFVVVPVGRPRRRKWGGKPCRRLGRVSQELLDVAVDHSGVAGAELLRAAGQVSIGSPAVTARRMNSSTVSRPSWNSRRPSKETASTAFWASAGLHRS